MDEIKLNVELPGMKKEDIKLTVSEGQLVLRGERKSKKAEPKEIGITLK